MQDSNYSYCTPDTLAPIASLAKDSLGCITSCVGLYAEVFRTDDTKLTTDMVKMADVVHSLADEGHNIIFYFPSGTIQLYILINLFFELILLIRFCKSFVGTIIIMAQLSLL